MLILTRKDEPGKDTVVIQIDRNTLEAMPGETIEIRVKILELRKSGVRIGINADRDIKVAREEVMVGASLASVFQDVTE